MRKGGFLVWSVNLTGRDWEKQAFSPEKIWTKFFALETSLANPPGSENKPNLALRPKEGPWGPLGAQNPQIPIFRGKYFFLLPFNWVLKNNPNESKKTKKLGIFRSVTPKNRPKWLGLPMVSRRPNFEFLYFFWSQIYHFVMAINFDCDEDRFWFFSDGIEPLYLGQGWNYPKKYQNCSSSKSRLIVMTKW